MGIKALLVGFVSLVGVVVAACTTGNPPDEDCIKAGGVCFRFSDSANCSGFMTNACATGYTCCAEAYAANVADGALLDASSGMPEATADGATDDARDGAADASADAARDVGSDSAKGADSSLPVEAEAGTDSRAPLKDASFDTETGTPTSDSSSAG